MEEFGEEWDRELDKEFKREFSGDFSGGFDAEPGVESVEFAGEFDGKHERRGVATAEMEERRQHPRYTVDALVEVLVADGSLLFRGHVRDISVAGCYIETEARLRLMPGTVVEMVFRLENAVYRVVAASKMLRPGKGAGFLFLKMDRSMRKSLDGLIAELAGT